MQDKALKQPAPPMFKEYSLEYLEEHLKRSAGYLVMLRDGDMMIRPAFRDAAVRVLSREGETYAVARARLFGPLLEEAPNA